MVFYHARFTNARLLFDRVDERLEWKHGRTHVPKGNKRLLCLVDDINLSQVCACFSLGMCMISCDFGQKMPPECRTQKTFGEAFFYPLSRNLSPVSYTHLTLPTS